MLQRTNVTTRVMLLGAFTACSSEVDMTIYTPPAHRDSSGITIVENMSSPGPAGDGWQVVPTPVVIGSRGASHASGDNGAAVDSTGVLLDRVLDIRVLEGGRIVVADAGRSQVMVFDSAGQLEGRFLRRGEGPGELSALVGLDVCGGDSIVVADRYKVAVFDARGEFARQAPYRTGGELRAFLGVSTDCRRLLTAQTIGTPPSGSWGLAQDRLSWIDSVDESTDSVTSARVLEVWTRQLYGVERPFVVPWGTSRTYATTGEAVVVGYGRIPEIRRYDASGRLVALARWSAELPILTRAEMRRYHDTRREWLARMPDDPESEFLFPLLDEYPELPATIPLFDRILVSHDGAVWIRSFPNGSFGAFDARLLDRDFPRQTWTVFDSTGEWMGSVALPERFDLKAVFGDRLYGVSNDADNVETVVVLELDAPAEPG
jgi:hypothetical protein